jgi:hypothetical protein
LGTLAPFGHLPKSKSRTFISDWRHRCGRPVLACVLWLFGGGHYLADGNQLKAVSSQEKVRRVAVADKQFGTARTVGSHTDRGRVYIAFGPPDQISDVPAHPNGDGFPLQEWAYRNLPGIGAKVRIRFVDVTLNFGYIIAPPEKSGDPQKDAHAQLQFEAMLNAIRQ